MNVRRIELSLICHLVVKCKHMKPACLPVDRQGRSKLRTRKGMFIGFGK